MANPNPRTDHLEAYCFTSEQSRQKAAINGRKGGIASGKAQRKKKSIAEQTMFALNAAMNAATKEEAERTLGEIGEGEDTLYIGMTAAMIREALNGNVKAFTALSNALRDAGAAGALTETEDDAFTAALRERASGL